MINKARQSGWSVRKADNRPKVDSPTYLKITRRIDEREYHRRLDQERRKIGLPPIRREGHAAG